MDDTRDMRTELAYCHDWFRSALDGGEGVNWLNGESAKYAGNAWDEAEKILRRLKKLLDR